MECKRERERTKFYFIVFFKVNNFSFIENETLMMNIFRKWEWRKWMFSIFSSSKMKITTEREMTFNHPQKFRCFSVVLFLFWIESRKKNWVHWLVSLRIFHRLSNTFIRLVEIHGFVRILFCFFFPPFFWNVRRLEQWNFLLHIQILSSIPRRN